MLFAQPMALDDMLQHALTIGEYATFSSLMRRKATQLAQRRQWLERADARRHAAERQRADIVVVAAEVVAGGVSGDGLRHIWDALGKRIRDLSPTAEADCTDGGDGGGGAAQRAERRLFAKYVALGDAPPTEAHEKAELYSVLGVPFSRLAMLVPQSTVEVMAQLRVVQRAIGESTRLGEQKGCAALIVDAVRAAHTLVDHAELALGRSLHEMERQSEALCAAWRMGRLGVSSE